MLEKILLCFNPYFTGLPILIFERDLDKSKKEDGFNPYFTGLPILIIGHFVSKYPVFLFQSLFYWITYSYDKIFLIVYYEYDVSILILLDYLFLFSELALKYSVKLCFNPYFTGLPILIMIEPMVS